MRALTLLLLLPLSPHRNPLAGIARGVIAPSIPLMSLRESHSVGPRSRVTGEGHSPSSCRPSFNIKGQRHYALGTITPLLILPVPLARSKSCAGIERVRKLPRASHTELHVNREIDVEDSTTDSPATSLPSQPSLFRFPGSHVFSRSREDEGTREASERAISQVFPRSPQSPPFPAPAVPTARRRRGKSRGTRAPCPRRAI